MANQKFTTARISTENKQIMDEIAQEIADETGMKDVNFNRALDVLIARHHTNKKKVEENEPA